MKIAVVIPGYNEEKYLDLVLKGAKKYTSLSVYVDDGSFDRSAEIARKYTSHVLVHESNLGKGAGMRTGCTYAFETLKVDAVVFMDADNQHDPAELPHFFKALEKGADVVFGVRSFTGNMPLFRFLGNKFASVMLNVLFSAYIPDIPSGYKAISKHAYEKLELQSSGYEIEAEIASKVAKHRLPYVIIPIQAIYHDKEKGMNVLDALGIAKKMIEWRLFS
ncbi:MAG: hypothetical protein A2378_02015 [Candidatus Pacebacteria bacterium RIFOXYB1_FULL_44_10]|nr:MAG: hypothetical protein A2378_02015 [Candidatus Pacebacteria bacterium RIFOXYB1_FULL_44_10]